MIKYEGGHHEEMSTVYTVGVVHRGLTSRSAIFNVDLSEVSIVGRKLMLRKAYQMNYTVNNEQDEHCRQAMNSSPDNSFVFGVADADQYDRARVPPL